MIALSLPKSRPTQLKPALIALSLMAAVITTLPVESAAASHGKWELVSTKDGVRVTRQKVPGSNMFAFRGVMTANVHIAKVIAVFANPKSRSKWVDLWDDDQELHVVSKLERKYWIRFNLPFPVSDRDYVLRTKATLFEKKRIFTAKIHSIKHPRAKKKSCCVRGKVERTYYKFEGLPGERTRLTVEVHTDPKGMLPAWLVNMIQKGWPNKTLKGLVRVAKGKNVKLHPDFVDWHTAYKPPAPPTPVAPPAAPAAPTQPAVSRPPASGS
ncbi:MAG: hypothetical protein KC502_12700 [Myxococcales bacterium]|nr:hypothetical protein [Myxococcales bacterium]